jgi:hypothetical protein
MSDICSSPVCKQVQAFWCNLLPLFSGMYLIVTAVRSSDLRLRWWLTDILYNAGNVCICLHPAERDKITLTVYFMLVFVFQHLFFIRVAELKRVTHAIFFCPFNVFPVNFYNLKLHLYFLTTLHSVIFNCGNRSLGASAVFFFMLPIWSRTIVNKCSEYETNRRVYLVRRAVGMTHLDRRMLDVGHCQCGEWPD